MSQGSRRCREQHPWPSGQPGRAEPTRRHPRCRSERGAPRAPGGSPRTSCHRPPRHRHRQPRVPPSTRRLRSTWGPHSTTGTALCTAGGTARGACERPPGQCCWGSPGRCGLDGVTGTMGRPGASARGTRQRGRGGGGQALRESRNMEMEAGIPKHLETWVGSVVTAERVSVCTGGGQPMGRQIIWQHVASAWREKEIKTRGCLECGRRRVPDGWGTSRPASTRSYRRPSPCHLSGRRHWGDWLCGGSHALRRWHRDLTPCPPRR